MNTSSFEVLQRLVEFTLGAVVRVKYHSFVP